MRLNVWSAGLAIVALFFGGCAGAQRHEGVSTMTIYYFPIEAETLTPVTSANIQERGKRCEILSTKSIDKIRDVLLSASSSTSQKFSDRRVRVKLFETPSTAGGLSAVVEKDGEVQFSDGKYALISPKGMETIKKIIAAECKP